MYALKAYYVGFLLKLFRDSYIFFLKYPSHKLIETHYQEFINFKMQMENDTKEKENKISDLKFKISKKNTAFSIIISSLALIVSIVAIILQFIK